jgi:hypothetical protein
VFNQLRFCVFEVRFWVFEVFAFVVFLLFFFFCVCYCVFAFTFLQLRLGLCLKFVLIIAIAIPHGNPAGVVMMIGEKIAAQILSDYGVTAPDELYPPFVGTE